MLAAEGRLLADGLTLRDQGLSPGSCVDVIRLTPPPALVRIACEGLGGGPSIRGSCGSFRRVEPPRTKNGRPIYMRDAGRSEWNAAMKYHGLGPRYLLFEEHDVCGKRWALTDDQDWQGYADRCYAFVARDVPHPGYLEDLRWSVYHDGKYSAQAERKWKEHNSLSLSIEED